MMRDIGRRVGLVLLGLAFALGATVVEGQGSADSAKIPASVVPVPASTAATDSLLEAVTRQLSGELRCPVCQGLSIGDSPSELALEMRGVIRDQVVAGKSPEEVRQYFLDKYGEWILLEPKAEGFNLVVYALPILALLGGAFVVWRNVRRWTAAGRADDAGAPPAAGA